eukprot:6197478-Pleurochrysis_carterae.AAC.2
MVTEDRPRIDEALSCFNNFLGQRPSRRLYSSTGSSVRWRVRCCGRGRSRRVGTAQPSRVGCDAGTALQSSLQDGAHTQFE